MAPKKKNDRPLQKDSAFNQTKEIKFYFNQAKVVYEKAKTPDNYLEAIEYLDTALEKSTKCPNVNPNNIYHLRGQCHAKLSNYQNAEKDFLQAINVSDEKSKITFLHSLIKCKLQVSKGEKTSQIQEYYKQFERAVEFSSNKSDGNSYLLIGHTNKLMGKIPDAIKNYGNSMKNLKSNQLFEAYFNRGLCYRQIEQIQNSIDDFLKAADLRKDEPYVQYQLGLNYLDDENYQEAKGRFNKAIELDSNEPLFYNAKGLTLYHQNQYQRSLSQTIKALDLYNNYKKQSDVELEREQALSQCYYNQANTLLHLGRPQQAKQSLTQSLSYVRQTATNDTTSILIKIYYAQGLTNERLGNTAALDNFNQCLKLMTQTNHKLYLPTLYHLALNQYHNKCFRQSIDSFSKILSHDCYDKCIYENRGKVYLELEMYPEALKDFEKVSEIQPNYPDVYFYKGIALNNLNKLADAIKDFFFSLQLLGGGAGPSQPLISKIYNGISESYLKLKQYEKSLFYSNIALNNNPRNQQFLVQRSKSYLEMNLFEEAIEDLTRAINEKPSNPNIYYRRGYAYYKFKNFQLAIKDLYVSSSLKPISMIESDIQYLLGICYANLEQFENAVAPLTKAIELEQRAKYYHERAKCYLLIDKNREALTDLNKVIQKQPQNAYAYFRRALAFKGLKKYQQTADDFETARNIKPDDPKLIINKKQIYEIKYKKLCDPGQEED